MVEIQFYKLVDHEKLAYQLNPNKRLLNVQAIVRMTGSAFECAIPKRVSGGGPSVSLCTRRGHGQEHRLSEDMHYAIMGALGAD